MKDILLHMLKTLLYPLIWCRQTVLEASEVCCDCDPIGFVDYLDYLEEPEPLPVREPVPVRAASRTALRHS